jgi:hypothetical protein
MFDELFARSRQEPGLQKEKDIAGWNPEARNKTPKTPNFLVTVWRPINNELNAKVQW